MERADWSVGSDSALIVLGERVGALVRRRSFRIMLAIGFGELIGLYLGHWLR
jgi:hypothetical protein